MPTNHQSPIHLPADRRSFLRGSLAFGGAALLGGPALLAACGDDKDSTGTTSGTVASSAASTKTVRTALSWVKNVEWAGWWVGEENGYFTTEGVKNQYIPGGPNAPVPMQVLAGGGADIGIASDMLAFVDTVVGGADFVLIGAVLQESPVGFAWLDPNIKSIKDLVGKRIGGIAESPIMIDACFKVNNIPKDYKFVTIGFDPAPLANGEIDAMLCYITNQVIVLEQRGMKVYTATLTKFGLPLYGDALFAKRSWLDANEAATVGYLRGLIKGWEQNAKDPAVAAKLVNDKYGADLGLDQTASTIENTKQSVMQISDLTKKKGLLWMDKDLFAKDHYNGLKATGRTNLPDINKLIDLSYLEKAFNGKTTLL